MASSYVTRSLTSLISQAYPAPEWAVFFEVSNGTGFEASRRADAVAVGVWPSRGFQIVGFECKSDRRDWLRELANPAKADVIVAFCDRWYIVTDRPEIAKPEEVPETWGLLVADEKRTKLLTKKLAPALPDRDLTSVRRSFMAAMLRKVPETTVPKADVERLVEARVKEAADASNMGRQLKYAQDEATELRKIVDTFKAITGVNMQGWQGSEKIAKAVDAVLHHDSNRQSLENTARILESTLKNLREGLAAMPPLAATELDI